LFQLSNTIISIIDNTGCQSSLMGYQTPFTDAMNISTCGVGPKTAWRFD